MRDVELPAHCGPGPRRDGDLPGEPYRAQGNWDVSCDNFWNLSYQRGGYFLLGMLCLLRADGCESCPRVEKSDPLGRTCGFF